MIRSLYQKYRQLIFYGIFGVLTTIVNILVYALCAHALGIQTVPSTIIAWILSVLFAYVTNRKWVFNSKVHDQKGILYEIASFFFFRLATGVLDVIIMHVFVDILHYPDVLIKVLSNILVIILNFLASKLVVFKDKNKGKN